MASHLEIHTTWGRVAVALAGGRVTACRLPRAPARPAADPEITAVESRIEPEDRAAAAQAEGFIRALFAGRAAALPPLAGGGGGAFFRKAWAAMGRIPRGSVMGYAELARRAGSPRAVRAAGQACAGNPLPLFVPCHRIVAASGRLGGFTGGLAWKRFLLRREGAPGADV